MTLGQKLKEIRKRFGLTQEELAEIMNVSRQAITKWENNGGLPDVTNLQELSKVFGITIDYLLNDENHLPVLTMKKELDKSKYKNKLSSYNEILKEYYPSPWEIYTLSRSKRFKLTDFLIDTLVDPVTSPVDTADMLSDLSPYYLIKKGNLRLLVNIKNWILTVVELPTNINDKKFIYENNKFTNVGKIKIKDDLER